MLSLMKTDVYKTWTPGPWTGSTGVVHGPGVHVLYTSDENSDESTEEGSCSPEEFSENKETSKTSRKAATGNRKPKASSSKKRT